MADKKKPAQAGKKAPARKKPAASTASKAPSRGKPAASTASKAPPRDDPTAAAGKKAPARRKPAASAAKKAPARKKPTGAAAKKTPARRSPKRPTAAEPTAAEPTVPAPAPEIAEGRRRAIVEGLWPEIDGGRHAIKRVVGETVEVEAGIFADGHEEVAARLLHRRVEETEWQEAPLTLGPRDTWHGSFTVHEPGFHEYTVVAWIDRFGTWRHDLEKRAAAGQALDVELKIGAELVSEFAKNAKGEDAARLKRAAGVLGGRTAESRRLATALDPALAASMARHDPRRFATEYPRALQVFVDRERARFSAWYELFPRSAAEQPGRHGTFADVEKRLPYIAEMGFDIVYLPPIHPIGRTFRKGRNNSVTAEPDEPGSPWAIGGAEGGHKSIHPELGTLEDFHGLVAAARDHGMEIALDIALQCAPDHPYVREHPEWFRARPDGTIQYAENPPKKYQDIYPFDFECADWRGLWRELCSIFLYWAEQGVKVFRVDNPHTKPFAFWAWCIAEVRRAHPDVIFLSEAFTRPRPMYALAKLGFTQSYTYFAWKNTKAEIVKWWTETVLEAPREYYRPNLWPNTPDILNAYLVHGGRPAFVTRAVLAATLGASWGMYGPAFELVQNIPREEGSEEYLDSEKYEIRNWDLERPDSLRHLIARLNRIRRAHPALQTNAGFAFHATDNDQLLCYGKRTEGGEDVILTVVNLDPHHAQSGWVDLDLEALGIDEHRPFQAHDLLTGAHFLWYGRRNFVSLDPHGAGAHVLHLRRHVRTEQDFDYFA
jgi:starch synthase (maltosyl-transferring)